MKKFIPFFPFFILLSACEPPLTRDQQLAVYRSRCLDYGYQSGTREFADCMKEQDAREDELALKERKARALEARNQIEQQKVRIQEQDHNSKYKITW
ncbi:MAG: hypothetical protein HYX35_05515 [Proteobacteria bacterium]|nr:hypothetical protein [Pseudomonadota bacterium]